jgi:uncharacterized protein
MGKKKIVIDTNNYISAFGWGGYPRRLLEEVIDGIHESFISSAIVEELRRVLDYPKFDFSEEQKKRFLDLVIRICALVEPYDTFEVCDDPKDNIFIECAVAADAGYVISGDDDILRLGEFRGIRMMKARDFLYI